MFRKTLTIFSLIGLLLSVGLWGLSYFCPIYFTDHFVLQAMEGRIMVMHSEYGFPMLTRRWRVHGFDGFETDWLPDFRAGDPGGVAIPLWMPCLVFAALPAYSLSPIHHRRKRKKLGLCLKCGYDLRASKERCPECGTGSSK